MKFYLCQEPGCTHKGTYQKSNIRKHLRQVHKVQDEYPEWFTQTYPDDRRKPEEVKEETKKRNLITKYANARKKRKLEALKKEFPFETIIDVVVHKQVEVPITVPQWPFSAHELRNAFHILTDDLELYSKKDLATSAWSCQTIGQWGLIFHPDKIGQRYVAQGGAVTDPVYRTAMENYPSIVVKPRAETFRTWQRWLGNRLELGNFDPPRTERISSTIQRRRWETEEVWLSFLQNEIAEVEAERQTTSSTNQPQDSDEESDF